MKKPGKVSGPVHAVAAVAPAVAALNPIKNRYTIVMFYDVTNGNPNGDPNAGNVPRTDPMTEQGLVSDVCIKRKIRNFVEVKHREARPYDIFVKEGSILNRTMNREVASIGIDVNADLPGGIARAKPGETQNGERVLSRAHMCATYFDIRTFGGVLTTGPNCGQVRGPVQVTMSKSEDPIQIIDVTLTRCAVTSERESVDHAGVNQTMGRKYAVAYGLYRTNIYVSPALAEQTGFGNMDFDLLIDALQHMWDHDRSASRGVMGAVKIVVFRHASYLGNCSDRVLEERIKVTRLQEIPRSARDYQISVDRENLPPGIEVMVFG